MPLLTEEELNALEKSPEHAAIAKKLKDMGEYIPKSRFDEVIQVKNQQAEALAKIEADRKAADDERARKAGEFEKLDAGYKAKIAELEKTAATEKETADQYRQYRAAKVEAMKKEFGDEWLPEYETFSIASLEKLQAGRKAKSTEHPDNGKPGLKYQGKTFAEMTPAERERYIQAVKSGELKT